MASSARGQDEPNRAMWLATRAGKMEPSCPLGTTRCIPQEKFPRKPYNKSFIDQVCSIKMAAYWPRSFFASLWTSTSSRSINTLRKNLANIQPSWPHTINSHQGRIYFGWFLQRYKNWAQKEMFVLWLFSVFRAGLKMSNGSNVYHFHLLPPEIALAKMFVLVKV